MTRIEQQGQRIYAVITELASEHTWRLEGEIESGGFLRGTYRAEGAKRILGTFLLAVDCEKKTLNGFWTRFEVDSREISAGRYSLRRCPD